MAGILPFGSIFIELYFIFTSFWNLKVRTPCPSCPSGYPSVPSSHEPRPVMIAGLILPWCWLNLPSIQPHPAAISSLLNRFELMNSQSGLLRVRVLVPGLPDPDDRDRVRHHRLDLLPPQRRGEPSINHIDPLILHAVPMTLQLRAFSPPCSLRGFPPSSPMAHWSALCDQDYRWHWTSFCSGGALSCALSAAPARSQLLAYAAQSLFAWRCPFACSPLLWLSRPLRARSAPPFDS